jgi:hypothetical protein
MKWLLNNEIVENIDQFPSGTIGFIYKITNIKTGKFYIGKKILENKIKKPLTKKESLQWDKPGRIPKKKVVIKESNWESYFGSCKPLLEDVKVLGKENFKREIIRICESKKEMSYYEVYYQFEYKVLHVDSYCENILGKFYRKDAQSISIIS